MTHGTLTRYTNFKCRCDGCRQAMADYQRRRRNGDNEPAAHVDHDTLSDLLNELFPLGLTDDCPARRKLAA